MDCWGWCVQEILGGRSVPRLNRADHNHTIHVAPLISRVSGRECVQRFTKRAARHIDMCSRHRPARGYARISVNPKVPTLKCRHFLEPERNIGGRRKPGNHWAAKAATELEHEWRTFNHSVEWVDRNDLG